MRLNKACSNFIVHVISILQLERDFDRSWIIPGTPNLAHYVVNLHYIDQVEVPK